VIYLDNILIFSENPTNYTETVQEILEKLKKNKFFANLKKYDFGTNMVEFLGFIIGPNRIEIDPLCVQAIKD
jgi:type IV secretory pathway VirB4 component